MDEEKQASFPTVSSEITVDEANKSISLPLHFNKRIIDLFYASCDEQDRRYALSLLQEQPLLPFIETVSISSSRFGCVPKLYIECLKDKAILIEDQRRMHSKIDCKVHSLDCDHSPFFSATDQLTKLICNYYG